MIINETLARAAFGTGNPIGKRIACCEGSPAEPNWKTVIGVVADVKSRGPAEPSRPEFYLPLKQIPMRPGPGPGARSRSSRAAMMSRR